MADVNSTFSHNCLVLRHRLANKIMGEGTCKITKMTIAFKQMENINNFLQACERYGIAKTDLFQTADLFEYTNMWQVILTCYALGRKVSHKNAHHGQYELLRKKFCSASSPKKAKPRTEAPDWFGNTALSREIQQFVFCSPWPIEVYLCGNTADKAQR